MKKEFKSIFAAAGLVLLIAGAASAAPTVRNLSVGAQQPGSIAPGGTASYTVFVTRAGGGSLDVYLGIVGLPVGCTATITPSVVSFKQAGPSSKSATVTISVPAGLTLGIYDFQLTARHGVSPQVLKTGGKLNVSAGQIVSTQPIITSVTAEPEIGVTVIGTGRPGHAYRLLASPTLENPVWTEVGVQVADMNGIFTIIEADTPNYSSRFYKFATE